MTFYITNDELLALVAKHEPEASRSLPSFRRATCVKCGRAMVRMWHLWLSVGGFKKEVHMCRRCGRPYECR